MTGALNNNNLGGAGQFGSFKPFGMNVKVPKRTFEQISESVKANISATPSSIMNYFKANEDVFNGKVREQIDSLTIQSFNTAQIMNGTDKLPHRFEMQM